MSILQKLYAFFIDTFQTFLLAASVFLVIYIFLFRPFQVNGQSMYPNFQDREYVLTKLIGYTEFIGFKFKFGTPGRGTVIVFKAPKEPEKEFIKRVIGLPGDRVYLRDGDVFINEEKLDESTYLSSDVRTRGGSFLHDEEQIIVPPLNYFVMGDNRLYSSDSREWGFVPQDNITGESVFVYWPPDRMRVVKNPLIEQPQ